MCSHFLIQDLSSDLLIAVQSLIVPEIRPLIKNAEKECTQSLTQTFETFSYNELSSAGVLPDDLTSEEFSPCDYLPNLQQVLFETDELNEDVTYETFVVIPDSLNTMLHDRLGNDVKVNGQFVSQKNFFLTSTFIP